MAEYSSSQCLERREGKPCNGAHGQVLITIEPISKLVLESVYHLSPEAAGIEVRYYGHRDDLTAAGCLKFGLYGFDHRQRDDGHGGSWLLESKAGPGRRGFVAVEYLVCSAAFAASFSGVTALSPEPVRRMRARPHWR